MTRSTENVEIVKIQVYLVYSPYDLGERYTSTKTLSTMNRFGQYTYRCFHSRCPLGARDSHYDVMRLPHDATLSDIKSKFKKLSLKLHPDMLKSQGLSDEEMSTKSEEYLKVKRSYEVLSDEQKRDEYDLHMGIKRRDTSSPNSYFNRPGNTFHFHEKPRNFNDVPHFDFKKHAERMERTERRYKYSQKLNQSVDTFGRDLYARNLGANGPRKGIYKNYSYQPNVRDDEKEGKKIAIKIVGSIVGIFSIWYILCGSFTTKKDDKAIISSKDNDDRDSPDAKREESQLQEKVNSISKSGTSMNLNNNYGLMLIKKDLPKRDDMEIFEEQVSETAE